MKITLRKANAIQNSIQELLRSIRVETTITISEYEDLDEKLISANTKLLAEDQRRSQLLKVLYTIRGAVGSANAISGIDAKLTEAAFLDKRMLQATDLVGQTQTDKKILSGKLERIKNMKEDHRLYRDEVTTGVMTEEQVSDIKKLIANLKKEKQKLNDEVLELNVRTEIEISNDVVNVLESENIL